MSNRFHLHGTPLPGVNVVERLPLRDGRGFLERLFCVRDLAQLYGERDIVQINHTLTVASGTVRGMHFQHPPAAESKLVTCLRGAVFDVAVDVRQNSPTFLRWYGQTLSAENYRSLWIPEGFAHGFQTLTDNCEMLYFHTAPHNPAAEGGLNPKDPRLAIDWPQPITEISERDSSHSLVTNVFVGVSL